MIEINLHPRKIAVGLAIIGLLSSCQDSTSTQQDRRQQIAEQVEEAIADPSADEVAIASTLLLFNKAHLNIISLSKENITRPKIHDLTELLGHNLNQLTRESAYLSQEIKYRHEHSTVAKIPALVNGMKVDLERLQSIKAPDYGKVFIDIEYNLHKTITQVITNQLIPNCENPELLDLLNNNMELYQHQLKLLSAAKEELAS